MEQERGQKSVWAKREEEVLAYWDEHNIFNKSLQKPSPKGEFVFYEGPPTANGRPGIHHLEARAFKDLIPRYKTMRGYHVRRKGGWDTHGLPVELEVEKELGLKSKKDIEEYGIAAFNEKCKESVWKYKEEWERFTKRMGYWLDLDDPYITYKTSYIESVWHILSTVEKKRLLYKDYKVVPWCPRCGTGLSSHELAQGYADVTDTAVFVKFKRTDANEYFLAWTTTPWTLPGNVALTVGEDVLYVKFKHGGDVLWCADNLREAIAPESEVLETNLGKDLVGMSYESLFSYVERNLPTDQRVQLKNAYRIYAADFVSTTEGTGIVHTAVMYGQDDFELGTRVGLPKYHVVNEEGKFTADVSDFAGMFVKEADAHIISNLRDRNLLFKEEQITHTYPFCWRCKTPLLYYARDSWYIAMSRLREKLIAENRHIHWVPAHIGEGRFGEWLRELKDWAISRSRYWGTPLPIWECGTCEKRTVIGSVDELKQHIRAPQNRYFVMRHGESESNIKNIVSGRTTNAHHLTVRGKEEVMEIVERLNPNDVDLIVHSPLIRTTETAQLLAEKLGLEKEQLVSEPRLREIETGIFEGKPAHEYHAFFNTTKERFTKSPEGGETLLDVKRRVGEVLLDLESHHEGKKILIISHEYVIWMLDAVAGGATAEEVADLKEENDYIHTGELRELLFRHLPRNQDFELDLHRPYIDEVPLACSCGGTMERVTEVLDVWFDSGAMPFAQDHYPFRVSKKTLLGSLLSRTAETLRYPADFISEAIDQTRGWFYTLHAIGVLVMGTRAYRNVICLGHVLDGNGKKMSKSVGNVVDPWTAMELYGADTLRFFMYSVNQPGDSKNFDESSIDDIIKRTFQILENVLRFYELYSQGMAAQVDIEKPAHVLDRWILAKLDELNRVVTLGLDAYDPLVPARAIRDFVTELSTWYIRRSRDRFKSRNDAERNAAGATTRHVLLELSKLMAPFTPFLAEDIYRRVGGPLESVHLEDWPSRAPAAADTSDILEKMSEVRKVVSGALEARASAKIKIRQPLASVTVRNARSTIRDHADLVELIKDEVNVKEVKFIDEVGWDIELDTEISPELKAEGQLRDLLRAIQDMRKREGLRPGELAVLVVSTDENGTRLLSDCEDEILRTAALSDIRFEHVEDGTMVNIDGQAYVFSIRASGE